MAENSLSDLMKFFGHPTEINSAEFRAFWETLTDAEKAEFKQADLS
jgi:hypothetical protein